MRVLFEVLDQTFKMHAEGMPSGQSQKIEMPWNNMKVVLYDPSGNAEKVILLTQAGSIAVLDEEMTDPLSGADKVVSSEDEDATYQAKAAVANDTQSNVVPVETNDSREVKAANVEVQSLNEAHEEPTREPDGFKAMSQHADQE